MQAADNVHAGWYGQILSEIKMDVSEIRWEVINSHECHFKKLEFFLQRANKEFLTRMRCN